MKPDRIEYRDRKECRTTAPIQEFKSGKEKRRERRAKARM